MDKAVELTKLKDVEPTMKVEEHRMMVIKYFNVYSQQIEGFKDEGKRECNKLALVHPAVTPARIIEVLHSLSLCVLIHCHPSLQCTHPF